jgi:hypothetical protein
MNIILSYYILDRKIYIVFLCQTKQLLHTSQMGLLGGTQGCEQVKMIAYHIALMYDESSLSNLVLLLVL